MLPLKQLETQRTCQVTDRRNSSRAVTTEQIFSSFHRLLPHAHIQQRKRETDRQTDRKTDLQTVGVGEVEPEKSMDKLILESENLCEQRPRSQCWELSGNYRGTQASRRKGPTRQMIGKHNREDNKNNFQQKPNQHMLFS